MKCILGYASDQIEIFNGVKEIVKGELGGKSHGQDQRQQIKIAM